MDLDASPLAFSSADAIARGLTRSALRHRVAHGELVRVAHDVYAEPVAWSAASSSARMAATAMARARSHHSDKVVSHLSAAAIHGYALPLRPGPATWLTVDRGGNRPRRSHGLVVERASLAPEDVIHLGDPVVAVTSAARTVADCLRHLGLADAVALGDSALRLDPALAEPVRGVLTRQAGWPGAHGGRTAYGWLDPRRETWLESVSWVRLAAQGLPAPEPQVTVLDERGLSVARVDFLWSQWGVVGEADGKLKYGLGAAGRELADRSGLGLDFAARSVFEEKRREDRLRDLGLEVVRWSMDDILRDPTAVARRIDAARERGDVKRFRGGLIAAPWPALRNAVS